MLLYKKRYFVTVSLLFFTQIAFIKTVLANDDSLSDNILICSKINDNQARLSCFDALTKAASAEIIYANENVKREGVVTELSEQDVDDFAKEQLAKTSDEQVNSITLTISDLSKNPYGKWTISFENGQKWQQKDSSKLSLSIGQRTVLTKGALSAVYLQKENSQKRIKVKRVK